MASVQHYQNNSEIDAMRSRNRESFLKFYSAREEVRAQACPRNLLPTQPAVVGVELKLDWAKGSCTFQAPLATGKPAEHAGMLLCESGTWQKKTRPTPPWSRPGGATFAPGWAQSMQEGPGGWRPTDPLKSYAL
jgi:hypothetical protein